MNYYAAWYVLAREPFTWMSMWRVFCWVMWGSFVLHVKVPSSEVGGGGGVMGLDLGAGCIGIGIGMFL